MGDWQIYIALLIVAVSVAFLVRRIASLISKRGCGSGCTGCSSRSGGKSDSQTVTFRNFS